MLNLSMRKLFLFLSLSYFSLSAFAQKDTIVLYKKTSAMIPMRDGVKLYTTILTPVNEKETFPILITRTPYGASFPIPDDTVVRVQPGNFNNYLLAAGGYIFI